jgi:hypothetical protein
MIRKTAFLFMLAAGPLLAQPYEPLLNSQNEWQFTTCFSGCITDMYHTDGDTLVGGLNYKILDGYHYISRTFLLREETSERRVYLNIVDPGINREYLLYDFSLEVGDSIDIKNPITPFAENAGYYQVDSIVPHPLNDGNSYRHFYLSPTPSNAVSSTTAVWIEGVGSLSIINAPGGYPDINGVGHLSCYFKGGTSVYSNLDSIDSCQAEILNVPTLYDPLARVELVNDLPAGVVQLFGAEEVRYLDLYDIRGKRINSFTNKGRNQFTITVSGYQPGVYLLVVQTRDFSKRMFKVLLR